MDKNVIAMVEKFSTCTELLKKKTDFSNPFTLSRSQRNETVESKVSRDVLVIILFTMIAIPKEKYH